MSAALAQHLFAAAVACAPTGEALRLHEQLADRLNVLPCPNRKLALAAARQNLRLVEYFEARNAEMKMLADIFARGAREQSIERECDALDAYWAYVADWLRDLGLNLDPIITTEQTRKAMP